MKKNNLKHLVLASALSVGFLSCVSSRIKPYAQENSTSAIDTSGVTIFLLERDIPQNIKKLGIVSMRINNNAGMNMDGYVKTQLKKDCQKLGANGAFRTHDGSYPPFIVSYLVFRY